MTWTAEDEEEFAPVDAGEHVPRPRGAHRGQQGPRRAAAHAGAVRRACSSARHRPRPPGRDGSERPRGPRARPCRASTARRRWTRCRCSPASMASPVRTRGGAADRTDDASRAPAPRWRATRWRPPGGHVRATMGASDVSSSPVDDAIAVGRMLGIDIPADRERQWAWTTQARSRTGARPTRTRPRPRNSAAASSPECWRCRTRCTGPHDGRAVLQSTAIGGE